VRIERGDIAGQADGQAGRVRGQGSGAEGHVKL
jgi:hypothetical protein